jgi:hypothetical protein
LNLSSERKKNIRDYEAKQLMRGRYESRNQFYECDASGERNAAIESEGEAICLQK